MHSQVKVRNAGTLFLLSLFVGAALVSGGYAAASIDSRSEKNNIDEYIVLLKENIGQQREQITGAVMQLTPEESKKFWPIYDEYEKALNKLKDSRVQNLKTYVASYGQMTDQKADHVVKEELAFRKQRDELMTRFYERFKQGLGAETAARFLFIESQIELISDLKLDSTLPIGG
jgi:Spy/CpxP family protein refolding chaperone